MGDDSAATASSLYARIGKFLDTHRLSPEPVHYEFAYRVLSSPDGPLAAAVQSLTEGGIRLTRKDIIALGGEVASPEPETQSRALHDLLVSRTQMQVDGFQDLVRSVRAEATGFGRDLAASAEAIRDMGGEAGAEIARLTSAMADRVRSAEARLEAATREAAELRAKLDEARDNARRDPLTNLPNRRAFEEAYAASLAAGHTHCVAVCDIDKFKHVNDSFGHAVGDRVLKAIGEVLETRCGDHLVARYGGEEFVVLFANVPIEQARVTLEGARATVAGKTYRLRETDAPLGTVTFSAGLTVAAPGEPLDAAFQRADALLYRAKEAGRNRLIADSDG
ncbi:GGDEF domain-containing protein [Sphingomonas sp. GlSt437]